MIKANTIEVSLTIVGKRSIRTLNKNWRSKDKETDVLSFPFQQYDLNSKNKKSSLESFYKDVLPLGDIVISRDAVEKVARSKGESISSEYLRLFVHGMFHLLGYDHERNEKEAFIQFELERMICESIGVKPIEMT